jgi:hypothetical protein
LKAVVQHGYKVKLIRGQEYSSSWIFDTYVNFFYDIKKNATNATDRFIAKMQLNQLYGYFGRHREVNQAIVIANDTLLDVLAFQEVHSVSTISDKLRLIIIGPGLNTEMLNKLNTELVDDLFKNNKTMKTNVAISAAVTAYARVEMMKFKTIPGVNVFYTDTDSIFMDKPLPQHMVSDKLGQMKDELEGYKIIRAMFLGNKKYCYQYINEAGVTITKSTFAGITKNSLS